MTEPQPYEIVIRFRRAFDVLVEGHWTPGVTEIRVPFADAGTAMQAYRDMSTAVRQARDAGGEDYRPVIAGRVTEDLALPGGGDDTNDATTAT